MLPASHFFLSAHKLSYVIALGALSYLHFRKSSQLFLLIGPKSRPWSKDVRTSSLFGRWPQEVLQGVGNEVWKERQCEHGQVIGILVFLWGCSLRDREVGMFMHRFQFSLDEGNYWEHKTHSPSKLPCMQAVPAPLVPRKPPAANKQRGVVGWGGGMGVHPSCSEVRSWLKGYRLGHQ